MTSAPLVPAPVTVRVPAKVNLELLVGPRRPDGYHALSTVFQAVSLYDDVTVAAAADWGVTDPILSARDEANPLRADLPEGRRPYWQMRT